MSTEERVGKAFKIICSARKQPMEKLVRFFNFSSECAENVRLLLQRRFDGSLL